MKKNTFALSFLLIAILVAVSTIGCDTKTEAETTKPELQLIESSLSALDVIEVISEEWKSSDHQYSVTQTADRGIDCARCHDGVGYAEQLEYETIEFMPDHQTGIDCQACHTGFGKDIIDAGVAEMPFTDKPFEGGTGAMCASCHNSNSNPKELFALSEEGNLDRFSYPHYGMNAALLSGEGGMEIPDIEYISSTTHASIEDSCVSCHMPLTKEGYKRHTFKAELEYYEETCGQCHLHSDEETFNIGGLQDEVKKKLDKLEKAILSAAGAAKIETSRGQFVYLDSSGEQIAEIPHEVYVATYNWQLINGDGSYGVHNPLYTRSLLNASYKYLTGEDL